MKNGKKREKIMIFFPDVLSVIVLRYELSVIVTRCSKYIEIMHMNRI